MKEEPKNFNGRIGHFHQCSNSGAFLSKAPSQTLQHHKRLKVMKEEHGDQISQLQDQIDELKKMVQSVMEEKKKPKSKE